MRRGGGEGEWGGRGREVRNEENEERDRMDSMREFTVAQFRTYRVSTLEDLLGSIRMNREVPGSYFLTSSENTVPIRSRNDVCEKNE